jgi:transposase
MVARKEKMLTVREAAERLGAGESSVRLWCSQGKFARAAPNETPRGPFWLIPESDLKGFEKRERGRPPKTANAVKSTTGQKNSSNGPSSKKKGRKK